MGPVLLNKRCYRELKPTNGSWRVDETRIRVKGNTPQAPYGPTDLEYPGGTPVGCPQDGAISSYRSAPMAFDATSARLHTVPGGYAKFLPLVRRHLAAFPDSCKLYLRCVSGSG
jgi:hypothetical protein